MGDVIKVDEKIPSYLYNLCVGKDVPNTIRMVEKILQIYGCRNKCIGKYMLQLYRDELDAYRDMNGG